MGCSRDAVVCVWMRGKRASPKERLVCPPCSEWLVAEQLADVYVHNPSPFDCVANAAADSLGSHPHCADQDMDEVDSTSVILVCYVSLIALMARSLVVMGRSAWAAVLVANMSRRPST